MPKIRRHFPLRIGSDLILLTASYLIALYYSQLRLDPRTRFWSLDRGEFLLLVVLWIVWGLSSRFTSLYDELRARVSRFGLSTLVLNSLVQAVVSIIILFFVKTEVLSRYFIILYFIVQLILLGFWRTAIPSLLRWVGIHVTRPQSLVIVGAGRTARDFRRLLKSMPFLGVNVVGFLDDAPKPELGDQYLGTLDDLGGVLDKNPVAEVVIAMPDYAAPRLAQVIAVCEEHLTPVRIIPSCYRFVSSRYDLSLFGNFPILSLRRNPLEEAPLRLLKSGLDLVVTIPLFILVFSWLWPVIAFAIKLDSKGPVFFKQERWGRKNRRIVCYKFRSMVKESRDCDENGNYLPAQRADCRLTRVGRFLRRTSLDELPQFLNVLKGEMSIVGPRPHPVPLDLEFMDKVPQYRLRYLVKPGLTGWAQTHGLRGPATDPAVMQKRVEYDLWYVENWSIRLDAQIVLRTLWLMVRGDRNAF